MQDYVDEALHDLLATVAGTAAASVRGHDPQRLGLALQELAAVACMGMDLGTVVNLLLLADDAGMLQKVRWPHIERGPKLSAKTTTVRVMQALLDLGERQQWSALQETRMRDDDDAVLAEASRHFAAAAMAFGNRATCRIFVAAARLLESALVAS